ncbi:MAG: VapE domain-containing protein [Burkholderiaceae bacterium]
MSDRAAGSPAQPVWPPVDIDALNDALAGNAEHLLGLWVGQRVGGGAEFKALSPFRSEKTPSFSYNLKNGFWGDFGGDAKGKGLVGLYAALHNLSHTRAAVELAHAHNLCDVAKVLSPRAGDAPPPRPLPPAAPPVVAKEEKWVVVQPVPVGAPAFVFRHGHYTAAQVDHTAEYRRGADLYGYICRVKKSDGAKEPLPFTWCRASAGNTFGWISKTFADPRPLYLPSGDLPADTTVVVVEGEKKADRLQTLLADAGHTAYTVVGWPGGAKVWAKADWAWLKTDVPDAGRTVLLWPDADCQRVLVPKAQLEGLDDAAKAAMQAAQPYVAWHKQPGAKAMLGIAGVLANEHGCLVQWLPLPELGSKPSGWDCGDMMDEGADAAAVLAYFATAQAVPVVADGSTDAAAVDGGDRARDVRSTIGARSAGAGGGNGSGGAGGDGPADAPMDDDAFEDYLRGVQKLMELQRHELGVNRAMVDKALNTAPALVGCLGYNELTSGPHTRTAWPWSAKTGPLTEACDLQLGKWLTATYRLKTASRQAINEGLELHAAEHKFHPIRDWLNGLQWDGKSRIDSWLLHVLGYELGATGLAPELEHYIRRVGRYTLLALCARVMNPGCKFDYTPVLESSVQGVGKSTLIKTLVGAEYFSDTVFDIGTGKDQYEQLQGLWGYELAELSAMRKADPDSIKSFLSSQKDRFRGAYGKYVQEHLRQLVIFASTNRRQYVADMSGARRLWPVYCPNRINNGWLAERREQLFAEALQLYLQGERYHPEPAEELRYFWPEQDKRLIESAVHGRLYELLTRDGAPSAERDTTGRYHCMTQFVTIAGLVQALGADVAKSSSLLENQIRGWLEHHGWEPGRETKGERRRGYKAPEQWPPKFEDDDATQPAQGYGGDGGGDDVPF